MNPNQVTPPPVYGYAASANICPACHQPIQLEWYFCPNCGNKLHQSPLKTDAFTQAWIYLFSIVLPMLCFLFITKWPGLKYYRSEDAKAKLVGTVAFILLFLSTVVSVWYAYVWTEQQIQSATSEINADMSY